MGGAFPARVGIGVTAPTAKLEVRNHNSTEDVIAAYGGGYLANTLGWRVNKNGYPMIHKTSAPAGGDMSASSYSTWLDTTAGAAKVMTTVSDSAGTVTSRTIIDNAGLTAVVLPLGSAAAPGVSLVGDANTGMYGVAADRIGFSVGGTLIMDMLSSTINLRTHTNPGTTNTYDLGGGSLKWRDLYLGGALRHTGTQLGFYSAAAANQPTGIVDADGTLGDITSKFNSLLSKFETLGLLAVA